ncbi:MAG: flippase-like domain-containing protein [Deltaproteobacteria bacterium]|nr:flippase-like domain-containing protein [Deltaproteobacteria bacterium]
MSERSDATPPASASHWLRNLAWALAGIATIVGSGWLFAHYTGGIDHALDLAGQISPARWLVVAALTFGFYALDWLRYYTLFRLLGHRFRFRLGLELVAISYLVSSLTPSAELHLPVMVIILVHRGYPVAHATAATVTKSIYMVMWVIVAGLVGLRAADAGRVPAVIDDHLVLWLATPVAIVLLLGAVVVAPGPIHRWCARRLARPGGRPWARKVVEVIDKLPTSLAMIARSRRGMHAAAHGACLAFIGAYVAIGHVIATGVGVATDARASFAANAVGLMVSYVAPVPGSIGVTEAATAHLLDPTMGPPAMTAAILVRICTWYLGAVIGALLLMLELRRIGWKRFRGEAA